MVIVKGAKVVRKVKMVTQKFFIKTQTRLKTYTEKFWKQLHKKTVTAAKTRIFGEKAFIFFLPNFDFKKIHVHYRGKFEHWHH